MLPYQVCKGVGVVEAGVAGGRDNIVQLVGWQAEVGHIFEAAVRVLDVYPVILQAQPSMSKYQDALWSKFGQHRQSMLLSDLHTRLGSLLTSPVHQLDAPCE